MRQWMFLGIIVLSLGFFVACSGSNSEMKTHMHGEGTMDSMQKNDSMKSSEAWIRSEPVDVSAVDVNQDGFVYQDPMDWNVIADEEGTCPKCGMFLEKVTIDDAVKHLKDNGYTLK